MFKIVWLELLPTPLNTGTSLLLGRLHWLPIEHCSIFKTALLVHKFLHSGYPKYFAPFLKLRQSVCNTHMVCSFRSPTLPLQHTSLLSILASALRLMLQRFGMICLMMYNFGYFSLLIEKEAQISLHKHIHPNFCFFPRFSRCGADPCYVSGL